MCISLWCDGREADATDEEMLVRPSKQGAREKRKKDQEEELEEIFLQLIEKHGSTYSGPQLRLWARMIVAKTHDGIDNPPNVPMITGFAQVSVGRISVMLLAVLHQQLPRYCLHLHLPRLQHSLRSAHLAKLLIYGCGILNSCELSSSYLKMVY